MYGLEVSSSCRDLRLLDFCFGALGRIWPAERISSAKERRSVAAAVAAVEEVFDDGLGGIFSSVSVW